MRYNEILENLQNLINREIKQVELAKATGITRATMNYRKNCNIEFSYEDVKKIEQYFNISFDKKESKEYITLEHIHISPSCGAGTTVINLPEVTPITLGKKMIESVLHVSNPMNLKVFTASGDSMEDTIDDGNLLLVDTGRTDFNNGGIFIITINNEWFVKRLRRKLNGQLDIISDNPAYPVESYMPDDNIEIVVKGRVIKNLSKGL